MGGIVDTAGRIGLGVATGGTSEIISQVLNIIPSIFQGISGLGQLGKARRLESMYPRPEAVIAPSVNKLVNYSYGQTLRNDIPGGEMYRNEIKGGLSAGLKAASEMGSGSEAYGALAKMEGNANDAFGDMAKTTAQQIMGYEDSYKNSLLARGNEENRVWDWNKRDLYLQAAQTAQGLRDSGLRNVNSGMKNVFGSTAEYINPDFNSSLLWGSGKGNSAANYTTEDVVALIKGLQGVANQPPSK